MCSISFAYWWCLLAFGCYIPNVFSVQPGECYPLPNKHFMYRLCISGFGTWLRDHDCEINAPDYSLREVTLADCFEQLLKYDDISGLSYDSKNNCLGRQNHLHSAVKYNPEGVCFWLFCCCKLLPI
ncbi:hypothetical protein D915_010533 [Fasciola hepatica]|uniref:Uncharacterized protein n=1 Tax=Fasciola hepatica TaxID=6192 RepID=A0A4E0R9W7_FASHE|nr:hypothetical protein D915_010533 [Fasciola hepatica]